jgi:PTS system nitrogen regulatory IIA component
MGIADLVAPGRVLTGLRAADKPGVIEALAGRAAAALGLDPAVMCRELLERERLGSTGVGRGTAIPHARLAGIAAPYGLLARLERPVDFEAIDGRPVDLVFLLLSPPGAGAEHLKALAAISRVTRDGATLERLRGARSRDALAAVLMGADEREAT